jgi:hypothetical protein
MLKSGGAEERTMNTNIDTANIPVGGSVTITNQDGSVAHVTVKSREVYDLGGIGLIVLATLLVVGVIVWLCNRQKGKA